MRTNNGGRTIEPARVKGFTGIAAANRWLMANPERVLGGVHFLTGAGNSTSLDFVLQINSTTKFFHGRAFDITGETAMPLQIAAQREIVRCAVYARSLQACAYRCPEQGLALAVSSVSGRT